MGQTAIGRASVHVLSMNADDLLRLRVKLLEEYLL